MIKSFKSYDKFNKKQNRVLLISVCVIVFLFIFPPWQASSASGNIASIWDISDKWLCENVESTLIRYDGTRDEVDIKDKLWIDFQSMEATLWHDGAKRNFYGKILENTMYSNNESVNTDGTFISQSNFVIDWGQLGKVGQNFQRIDQTQNVFWQTKTTNYVVPQGYDHAGKKQVLYVQRKCVPN
jgi:hypothetical protein